MLYFVLFSHNFVIYLFVLSPEFPQFALYLTGLLSVLSPLCVTILQIFKYFLSSWQSIGNQYIILKKRMNPLNIYNISIFTLSKILKKETLSHSFH